jgi:membrane protein DedA with SNARE-associated domain
VPLQVDIGGFLRGAATEATPVLRDVFASEAAPLVLLAVFLLEGAMLLYFVPSEGIVPAAVLLIGTEPAAVALVLGVAVLGATAGQFALFSAAKRLGRERLLEKRWFRIGEGKLARFDGWFDRWGPVAVPVSNTLLFTRGMLTVPAGLAEMDDREFIVLSAVGTLSFECLLAAATLFLLGA